MPCLQLRAPLPCCWEAKKKGKNPFNDNPGQWIKKKKDFFNKNLQMDLREKDTSAKKRRNKEEIQRWRREECEAIPIKD